MQKQLYELNWGKMDGKIEKMLNNTNKLCFFGKLWGLFIFSSIIPYFVELESSRIVL